MNRDRKMPMVNFRCRCKIRTTVYLTTTPTADHEVPTACHKCSAPPSTTHSPRRETTRRMMRSRAPPFGPVHALASRTCYGEIQNATLLEQHIHSYSSIDPHMHAAGKTTTKATSFYLPRDYHLSISPRPSTTTSSATCLNHSPHRDLRAPTAVLPCG